MPDKIPIGPSDNPIKHYKVDHRPPQGGWAEGNYMNICINCGQGFVGDKRATNCADCAYAVESEQRKATAFMLNGKRCLINPFTGQCEEVRDGHEFHKIIA